MAKEKGKEKEKERDVLRETYEFFLESAETELATKVIAKHIFGKGATKKMINPTLYELQRLGVIERTSKDQKESNPHWRLPFY